MRREEAAEIYLNGLMLKNVEIGRFFEAARILSEDDRAKIQLAIERYATKHKEAQWKKSDDLYEENFCGKRDGVKEYGEQTLKVCFG